MLAYLMTLMMTLELETRGAPPPRRLFCSGRGAAHIVNRSANELLRMPMRHQARRAPLVGARARERADPRHEDNLHFCSTQDRPPCGAPATT